MYHRTSVMIAVLLSGTLTLGAAAGCGARTTKTTQTVTTEETAPAADSEEAEQPRPGTTTVTTTTTTERGESSHGIVGSAFLLVWAVVTFPFRVIGALV